MSEKQFCIKCEEVLTAKEIAVGKQKCVICLVKGYKFAFGKMRGEISALERQIEKHIFMNSVTETAKTENVKTKQQPPVINKDKTVVEEVKTEKVKTILRKKASPPEINKEVKIEKTLPPAINKTVTKNTPPVINKEIKEEIKEEKVKTILKKTAPIIANTGVDKKSVTIIGIPKKKSELKAAAGEAKISNKKNSGWV